MTENKKLNSAYWQGLQSTIRVPSWHQVKQQLQQQTPDKPAPLKSAAGFLFGTSEVCSSLFFSASDHCYRLSAVPAQQFASSRRKMASFQKLPRQSGSHCTTKRPLAIRHHSRWDTEPRDTRHDRRGRWMNSRPGRQSSTPGMAK